MWRKGRTSVVFTQQPTQAQVEADNNGSIDVSEFKKNRLFAEPVSTYQNTLSRCKA
jgi:hypothetical protein